MRHWPVFRPACLTVSSPSSTRQRGRSPVSVVQSILQMISPVSTGSERIKFELAVIVYRALHGPIGPASLRRSSAVETPRPAALVDFQCSLLNVRPSRLVTVGDRSFATAGPRLWNSLPVDVQSAPPLTTFRHKLKTHLFRQLYPDIVL